MSDWLRDKDRLFVGLLALVTVGITSFMTYTLVNISDLKTRTAVLEAAEKNAAEWRVRMETKLDKLLETR